MPRFLVEAWVAPSGESVELAPPVDRFPEVQVERTYISGDGAGQRLVAVCRAPSEAHIRRWLAATDVEVSDVRRIVDAVPPRPHDPASRDSG